MVRDTVFFLHQAIQEQKKVIVEGANATMLDIDFGIITFFSHSTVLANFLSFPRDIPICDLLQLYSGRGLHGTGDSPA